MPQSIALSVRQAVTVAVPQAHAFEVFTRDFATWWPPTHHTAQKPMQAAVIEPRQGGRWFERSEDGSEHDWGRVLTWDPPRRLVLAWQLTGEWTYDPDPARASEVEVRFIAQGPASTRVELEHRHLERHGKTAEALHKGVSSPDGWPVMLARFAQAALAA